MEKISNARFGILGKIGSWFVGAGIGMVIYNFLTAKWVYMEAYSSTHAVPVFNIPLVLSTIGLICAGVAMLIRDIIAVKKSYATVSNQ